MASPRLATVAVALLAGASGALALCTPQAVEFPPACPGVQSAVTVRFCFAPEAGCGAIGTVVNVTSPAPPFAITALRVEGFLGSHAVSPADFPLDLGLGDALVADVTALLAAPGDAQGSLAWLVGPTGILLPHGGDEPFADSCEVDLHASTPPCAALAVESPCSHEECVGGVCVRTTSDGPCDDGDPCTIGDSCHDGECRPGTPLDCGGDACTAGGVCEDGRCVGGGPVSCDDGDPCTADRCDPERGCVHERSASLCPSSGACMAMKCDRKHHCELTPITGAACDDGDACTTDDHCVSGRCTGTPIRCGDGIACTEDRCVAGACQHVPADALCDSGACVIGKCLPGAPEADRNGCVSTPVGEGEQCTDDGVSCTDDVCTGGTCLHPPVDRRCGSSESCTAAVCAPERKDHDASGCAPGQAVADGDMCVEDGDPCTDDVCRTGGCIHRQVSQWATCTPVAGAFKKALGLMQLTRGIQSAVIRPASAASGDGVTASLDTRLGHVTTGLDGAVRALSGRMAVVPRAAGAADTPAQERARMAFAQVVRTPREVQSFLTLVGSARARASLGAETSRSVRHRGRVLLRGTKSLKGDLKRLQQVSRTFAR